MQKHIVISKKYILFLLNENKKSRGIKGNAQYINKLIKEDSINLGVSLDIKAII